MRHPIKVEHGLIAPWSPLDRVGRLAIIIGLSSFAGIVVPGIAAFHSNVFFKPSMDLIVRSRFPETQKALDGYYAHQHDLHLLLVSLDKSIVTNSGVGGNQAGSLVALRQEYKKELLEGPPFSVQPFYLHILMYFWPVMFSCLGAAIFILKPPLLKRAVSWKAAATIIGVACGIDALQMLPIWFRTHVAITTDQGRKIYAYSNPDLSAVCFSVQLFHFALFSILLAVIWYQWSVYASDRRSELQMLQTDGKCDLLSYSRSLIILSRSLLEWQFVFACVSLGFVLYTAIFWTQIIRNLDQRLWPEAIVAHLLWFTTLALTATPLALTWHHCQLLKLRVIAFIAVQAHADDITPSFGLDALHELEPVGSWNAAASLLAILTSLIGPVAQAFVK